MIPIIFHTFDQTTEIAWHDYAHISEILADMLAAQMARASDDLAWLPHILPAGHRRLDELAQVRQRWFEPELRRQLKRSIAADLHLGRPNIFSIDGTSIDTLTLWHNSTVQWGSPALQLAVKLHRHSEDHAYCEAEDRDWLADLIEQALDDGILRATYGDGGRGGWNRLIAALRQGPEGPVVTSQNGYRFPNDATLRDRSLDMKEAFRRQDAFQALSPREQWDFALAQARSNPALRIGPDNLAIRYGHGLSGLDLMDIADRRQFAHEVAEQRRDRAG